jgi:hypothetical protein
MMREAAFPSDARPLEAVQFPRGLGRVLRTRAWAIFAAAIVGLAVAALDRGETPEDVKGLAEALGRASGTFVRADELRWEPSSGIAADFFAGRSLLFLGSASPEAPRDVYRARVRLSPEGRVVDVVSVRNLTSTPLGDDHALVVAGSRAAYATYAFGQEQSVTALDLSGEGAQNETTKLHDRAMAYLTNVQQTGNGEGVGRIDVTLDQPAQRVGLALSTPEGAEQPTLLTIDLADDGKSPTATRTARLDLVKNELVAAPQAHAEAGKHLPKWFVFWAVDTVRAVPWIGPEPIAWLEEKASSARDSLKQTAFKVSGGKDALAKAPDQPAVASILDTSQASADLGHWPPPAVRSIWKNPEPGEGEWGEPKQPWLKRLPPAPGSTEVPPLPFVTTFVRPDEERPYAKVLFVAMDMRQLDLDMEAGSEDPKPLVGPPGTGRIPRDPAVYTRVAAAFNGGFKTEHGNYGMMLKKRVLLPPLPGAATVIVTKDGHVGMGSWGTNKDVGGIHDVPSADILSFRQNLDPLVDNDKVNPQNRWQWGFTLPGTSMQTERTGICITNAGHMLYAWGDDLSATSLGKAMKMAGCIYGMHLDMNPHHTGLVFTNINEFKERRYKSELLTNKMEIGTDRYLLYAPKDFFYVTLHDPTPPAVESATWEADPGVQPAPSWMPGLWRTRVDKVELFDIEPARASFRVRTGTKEPDAKVGPPRVHELSDDDAHRVLFALTLGTSETKHTRGLVTEGKVVFPMSGAERMAALVVSEDGVVDIAKAGAVGSGDAVELPLLIDEGKPVARGHGRANAALGIAHGRTFVARSSDASVDDLVRVLEKAGCSRAVLLDRGAGNHGMLYRAGTPTPPRARYEDTTLYAMSKPLLPRGFRFEATSPVEPPAPKKK